MWDWNGCLERSTLLLRDLEIDFWCWVSWWYQRLWFVWRLYEVVFWVLTHGSWLVVLSLRLCFRSVLDVQPCLRIFFRFGDSYGLRRSWRQIWSISLPGRIYLDSRSVISPKVSWRIQRTPILLILCWCYGSFPHSSIIRATHNTIHRDHNTFIGSVPLYFFQSSSWLIFVFSLKTIELSPMNWIERLINSWFQHGFHKLVKLAVGVQAF